MVDLPSWSPFDVGAAPALPRHEAHRGRMVAVVTSPSAEAGGWAADAALQLAGLWTAEGERVVLADAGVERPSLHRRLGIPNAEGVSDVAMFGSSVRRVAKPTEAGDYFVVTAGSAVADPDQVFSSERFGHLCDGFLEAGVTLVTLIPTDCPGADRVVNRASDVIVFHAELEGGADIPGLADDRIRWVSGPDGEGIVAVDPADEELASEPADEPVVDDFEVPADAFASNAEEAFEESAEDAFADSGEVDLEGLSLEGADEPSIESDPEEHIFSSLMDGVEDDEEDAPETVTTEVDVELAEPVEPPLAPVAEPVEDAAGPVEGAPAVSERPARTPPSRKKAPEKKGSRNVLLLVLSLVLLGIVVAAAMGWVEIPGLSPESTSEPAVQELEQVARSIPLSGANVELTHSVAVGAFQDAGIAASRSEAFAGVAGAFVTIAPVLVDGSVFHRVLLGPATDSFAAEELADRVAGELGASRSGWVVRATPVAFELGEVSDEAAAGTRVGTFAGMGIAAYSLPVEYADGSTRFRIYAGAYADEAEASYLHDQLIEQGARSASLKNRISRLQ